MSSPRPPLDFLPIQACHWAELFDGQPEFIHRPVRRGRRLQGIKYEAAGQVWLRRKYGDNYTAGQWIRFKADGNERVRWCQPDGILVDPTHRVVTIIEFKYQHTDAAWWQLFRLYLPVMQHLFTGRGFAFKCLEICKWFDPSVKTQQAAVLCKTVDAVQPGAFGVHIWKP